MPQSNCAEFKESLIMLNLSCFTDISYLFNQYVIIDNGCKEVDCFLLVVIICAFQREEFEIWIKNVKPEYRYHGANIVGEFRATFCLYTSVI